MPPVKKVKLDLSKIKMAIRAGIPLSITTYTLPREMEAYIDSVLKAFLNELNQDQMSEYLTYCLNELLVNSKKANTKRIFFKQKNLDIFNEEQYSEGIKSFKSETLSNIRYYLDLQKKAGLYVKFVLQARNNKIKIEVRNNSELTEGAGLGLIIMILMLEKIGLTEENFQILCENGETITRIILPLDEKTQKNLSVVSREFVNLIDELPQFPDSVMRINRLLNNPDSKMSEIATLISSDISLTSDLLKLVNSATFALASPCRSISDADKLVGIRGIKNMILSVSSMNVLNTLGEETKALWTHAYRVAFYTYNLARNFCSSNRTIVEDSYICGLLHDMGKLIFETTHPAYINRIKDICAQKGIQPDIFEKLVAGVNHGEIGALIAEKWNFPEVIVSVIRHHHEPDLAPENVKKLTEIVYLSDMLAHYQEKDIDFYQFDQEVLANFHITNEIQLQKISNSLEKAFDKESQ